MKQLKIISKITSLVLLLMLVSNPALGNGGDFFEELALHGLKEYPEMGSPFFGFVRDSNGRGVNKAVILFSILGNEKSVFTNILGHYTTGGFHHSIDAGIVNIFCIKEGYRMVRIERRQMMDRTLQPIEANCIMEQN
jgi:hypothetical protein